LGWKAFQQLCELVAAEIRGQMAEHFDAPLENIFEVLECVATSVAGVIEPASDLTEQERLDRLGRGA
jgi:hypothetical protein